MSDKQIRLLGFVKIAGEIEALTGLHIGGTADSIDKGGIDSPVIKNPVTNEPYIPGSSLRGRMRSLLELKTGAELSRMSKGIYLEVYKTDDYINEVSFTQQEFDEFLKKISDDKAKAVLTESKKIDGNIVIYPNRIQNQDLKKELLKQIKDELEKNSIKDPERAYRFALKSPVCRVFGNSASDPGLPSVLIVRDAIMSEKSRKEYMKDGLPVTEAKMEIVVDRITAQAMPRTIERVPAGAFFAFEMIYKVQTYENGEYEKSSSDHETKSDDKLREDLENLICALEIIQNHAGLGGNTSRGHGQVKFHISSLQQAKVTNGKICEKELLEKKEESESITFDKCIEAIKKISFFEQSTLSQGQQG